MTSEQVLLTVAAALILTLTGGCAQKRQHADPWGPGVYPEQQVFAVVPLRNESGSLNADGLAMADALTAALEQTPGIDTIPVNRVLLAMESVGMTQVTSPAEAMALRQALGVDGLLVGNITAYDPYDPPKLGLALELYVDPARPWYWDGFDVRHLTWASVDGQTRPDWEKNKGRLNQPLTVVSGYFDAGDPFVKKLLQNYGEDRGVNPPNRNNWRLYRLSMDLYTEFVAHVVCDKLVAAERNRLLADQHDDTTDENQSAS